MIDSSKASLANKTALVTGAANRLGAQIVRTLHQNGANLIIHYRHSKKAALALTEELNSQRPKSAVAIVADLSSILELENLAKLAVGEFNGLDILVNNASSFYPCPIGEINDVIWNDLIDSNFKAPLFLSQACYPALKRKSGCIINMLDIYATKPLNKHSLYCCAKAANQMLVQSLALELAPEVRVNAIAPGAIIWPEQSKAQHKKEVLQKIPLNKLGNPQTIGDTVLFLALNDYITGEVIRVDGGRLLSN